MKDAYYFPHDSNAHKDTKVLGLRIKCGWEGVGLYWTFVELLRDTPGYRYPYDLATLELGLSTAQATLQATLQACFDVGLLVKSDGFFSSPSLDRRMAQMDAKRLKLIEAGRKGGLAKPGLSHPQAVKERKGKESSRASRPNSAQEVTDYGASIGFKLNGQDFIDHYEKCGWVFGKNRLPVKDWKACVRTWKKQHAMNAPAPKALDFIV